MNYCHVIISIINNIDINMNTNDALVENRFCVVGCINLILDEMVLTIICDEA